MRLGDGVLTPAGHTGKVYQIRSDGFVKVRLATGPQAGQIRSFKKTSLRML